MASLITPLGSGVLSWVRVFQYNTEWLRCPQHKSNVIVSKQEFPIMIRNKGPVECLTSLYCSPQHKSRGPVDCLTFHSHGGSPPPPPPPLVGRERCRVPGFTDRKLSWNSRQVSKLPGMVHKIYQMYSHSHGEDRSITI